MKKILLLLTALLRSPLLQANKPKPTPINYGLSAQEEEQYALVQIAEELPQEHALAQIAEELLQAAQAPAEENANHDGDQEEFADNEEAITLHEALINGENDPETLNHFTRLTVNLNSFYQPENVDPNDEDANIFTGLTAMAIAARHNNVAALNALSQANANINLPSNQTRYTPFYDAITTKSNDAITWFINNPQTDLTLEVNQETPFMTLLRMLNEVIQDKRQKKQTNFYFISLSSLLLRMDINHTNSIGQTPLIYAVQRNFSPRIVQYLLDKGADQSATWENKTALDIAKRIQTETGQNKKIVTLLEKHTPQGEQQTKRSKKTTTVKDKRKYQGGHTDDDTGGNNNNDDTGGMA